MFEEPDGATPLDPDEIAGLKFKHITTRGELIDNSKYWVDNDTYSPLETAARFHHRLVQIHPFTNGNGRHARIACDALLKEYFNHPPIDWAKGGNLELTSTRRDAYISALRAADAHEFNQLFAFIGAT